MSKTIEQMVENLREEARRANENAEAALRKRDVAQADLRNAQERERVLRLENESLRIKVAKLEMPPAPGIGQWGVDPDVTKSLKDIILRRDETIKGQNEIISANRQTISDLRARADEAQAREDARAARWSDIYHQAKSELDVLYRRYGWAPWEPRIPRWWPGWSPWYDAKENKGRML